ncbi:MAG TPA: hypothetical protein VN903_06035 [Polyangia bacterium]|nr:hypothetical protein [Polyangia bacterium]
MGKLKAAAVAVGGAYAATKVVDFLGDATRAAEEDEKSQKLLATQIRDTTAATDQQIAGVEEFIGHLSRQTGIMDEDLRPAYASLVRATKDTGKAQAELATAMDIAAGRGVDLQTVVVALEKAHNGQTTSLSRMGIATKDAAGNILTLDQIMQNAAKTYAGAAEAAITPSQRWKVATEELKESIGAHLLPIIGKLEEMGAALLAWFDSLSPGMQTAIEVALGLGVALTALAAAFAVLGPVIAAVGIAIGILTSPITLIVIGIAALVAGLIYAYTHFETFRNVVDTTVDDVQKVITGFIDGTQKIWEDWGGAIEGVFNALAGTVKTQIAIVLAVVQPIIDLLHGDWGKAWDDFSARISDAWAGIVQTIGGAVSAIVIMLGNLIGAAERVVADMVKAFAGLPGKILDQLPGPVRAAVEAAGWVTGVTPVMKAASAIHNLIPGIASGGTIEGTGLAIVHKGETVIPAGAGVAGGMQIGTANIYLSGVQNVDQLAAQLSQWADRQGGWSLAVRTPTNR